MAAARYRLGIDFGTSTTVAMLARPDGQVEPLLFDGSPLLASAVYLEPDGHILVGRDAVHSARVQPARFEPNPKNRIDEPALLLGEDEVPLARLVAGVLRRVSTEAHRVAGQAVGEVVLTHPAAWGSHRRAILLEAAHLAGLGTPMLVPEPVAAAAYFARRAEKPIPVGSCAIVYDLGAGTFDVTLVRHTPDGFAVVTSQGLPDLGGLDVDAALVAYLGAVYADRDPPAWSRLEAPQSTGDLRQRRQLWEDIRTAKELLSRSSSTTVYLPAMELDTIITREQLDRLAAPLLARTVEATRAAIRQAGVTGQEMAGVFLVGGGSRMPLVATLLHRALQLPPVVIEQPELAVASGSLATNSLATGGPATGNRATRTPRATPPTPPTRPLQPAPAGPFAAPPAPAPPLPSAFATRPPAPARAAVRAPTPARPVPARPVPAPRSRLPIPDPALDEDETDTPATAGFHPWRRSWRRSPVHVVDLALPSHAGYTLRAIVGQGAEREMLFLVEDGRLPLFETIGGLTRYAAEASDHPLETVPDWPAIIAWMRQASIEVDDKDRYVFDHVTDQLNDGPDAWMPWFLTGCRDVAVELAMALELDDVLDALGDGSYLDRFDDALRAADRRFVTPVARARLRRFDVERLVEEWTAVIAALDSRIDARTW